MSKTISPAAADALRAATADKQSVRLAPGQLDRKVYVEVNTVLERIAGGGKWNRKAKAHLFGQDPRPALAELVGAEDIELPADQVKLMSFWRTPGPLAARMAESIAGLPDLASVLEPSAGDGAIADAVRAAHPGVCLQCVEADEGRAAILNGKGHVTRHERFQDYAAKTRQRFDAVLMNPPFTEVGNATAWVDHIDAAWSLLKSGGFLLAIAPTSYEHRTTRKIADFRERTQAAGATWTPLGADAFKDSGTGVSTGLLAVAS